MHEIRVLNKHTMDPDGPMEPCRVLVMRGRSPLANPHRMRGRSHAERDRVCDAFRQDLWRWVQTPGHPALRELERLHAIAQREPLDLVCCCAPLRCHAHTIRSALKWLDKRANTTAEG